MQKISEKNTVNRNLELTKEPEELSACGKKSRLCPKFQGFESLRWLKLHVNGIRVGEDTRYEEVCLKLNPENPQ